MIIKEFRLAFPEFSDMDQYPDERIKTAYQESLLYFHQEHEQINEDHCRFMTMLMTAHLLKIGNDEQAGQVQAITTSESVGDVSTSMKPPPGADKSQWSWWLSLTSYGQRLSVLFYQLSIGGFYFGGRRIRSAMRT